MLGNAVGGAVDDCRGTSNTMAVLTTGLGLQM